MNRVVWTPLASGDLEAIDDYLAEYSVESAEEIAAKIEAAASFLLNVPHAGTPFDSQKARKWRVATTPYLLVYRPVADHIEILRVYHARQNWREEP
jgi:plasmid stabilization system protein ParE